MKEARIFLAILAALLVFLPSLARAQEPGGLSMEIFSPEEGEMFSEEEHIVTPDSGDALVIETEPLLDNLDSREQVRWYGFEMTEPGDAVLMATGLQENWDGYPYHWSCAICEGDRETIITQTSVRGYSKNNGPSILSAPGLEAGIYYIRMSSVGSSNPLMAAFTSEPYELQLLRYYPSASASFQADDGLKSFQNAGEVLWAFDGTAFLKLYNGECWGALMENRKGAVVPVLIGGEEDAVAYVISSTGEIISGTQLWNTQTDFERCYYSDCGYIGSYTDAAVDPAALPMLYLGDQTSGSVSAAAKAIAQRLVYGDAVGEEGENDRSAVSKANTVVGGSTAAEQMSAEEMVAVMGRWAKRFGIVVGLICLLAILKEKIFGPSGSYSGLGSGSSLLDTPPGERTFTQGGPTGCGIGGSYCGCGGGR